MIQLNPMKRPSILPAATSCSPSSTESPELRNSLVFLTKGRNVSRTSCWIALNLPLRKRVVKLMAASSLNKENDTNRQIQSQALEHIALK